MLCPRTKATQSLGYFENPNSPAKLRCGKTFAPQLHPQGSFTLLHLASPWRFWASERWANVKLSQVCQLVGLKYGNLANKLGRRLTNCLLNAKDD